MSGNEKINIERRANNKKTLANVHGIRGDLMIITMDRRKKGLGTRVQVGPLFKTLCQCHPLRQGVYMGHKKLLNCWGGGEGLRGLE